jgi:predicted TIM-barrel fold metal-dependent hydrolase
MKGIDVNCLVGHWPFRRLYKNTFEDVQKIHRANNISKGYIASLNSIFYNDPFEGDQELHEIIKDTDYHHVLTINPKLPGYVQDLKEGIQKFDIKGVRIYPGYHGYTLQDRNLKNLCDILKDYDLPLFLSLRMEDERLNYLSKPAKVETSDIKSFLSDRLDNKIVLLTAFFSELTSLAEVINNHKYVRFDTSGLKDQLFNIEKLLSVFSPERIVYGSLYPLYTFSSTYLAIKEARIDDSIREDILTRLW